MPISSPQQLSGRSADVRAAPSPGFSLRPTGERHQHMLRTFLRELPRVSICKRNTVQLKPPVLAESLRLPMPSATMAAQIAHGLESNSKETIVQLTVSRGPHTPHSSTYAHGSQMAGLQVLPIIGHMDVLAGRIDCPAQFDQCLP